jgi:hypothetical protein
MARALCALVLCAVVFAPRARLTLGVLRADGLLIPFASYAGDWSVPWPTTLRYLSLPISLHDVDRKWWGAAGPDASWTANLPGAVKRPLALEVLRQVRVFCTPRLGIQTDYRGAPPSPDEPTVQKDGLAIAGDAELLPIEHVAKASSEWTAMARAIADKFNDAENDAAKSFLRWKHPFKAEQRRAVPIQLEAFYRASEQTKRGAWRESYIEAVRSFPARKEDNGCGLITYAYGWVLEREGHEPRIELRARVTYCDRAGVSFMQPFGRLLLDDDVYWVYQMSSWQDEAYTVSRVRPDDVAPAVVAFGGSCPG